jgi:hypothetical protein
MDAMHRLYRTNAVFAVLAIIVLACGQSSVASPSSVPSLSPRASATTSPSAIVAAPVPEPPSEFTGRIECGPPVSGERAGTETVIEVGERLTLTRQRDGAWRQGVSMTDERLMGDVVHTWESDGYATTGAETGATVSAATFRIVNPGGSWVQRGFGASYLDGTAIGGDSAMVFVGEGGYSGLVAIMEVTAEIPDCGIEVKGVIFDGAPVPEPYVAP